MGRRLELSAGLFAWAVAACVAGCGRSETPRTIDQFAQEAEAARSEAEAARVAKDPTAAAAAADRAEQVAKALGEALGSFAQPTAAQLAAHQAALSAAGRSRLVAQLAGEERLLADLVAGDLTSLSGAKVRAYRSVRGVALASVFQGLALAADQAAKQDFETLPAEVRQSANTAADLAECCTGRSRPIGGQPDWTGIAMDMRQIGSQPPSTLCLHLAVMHLILGDERLALAEVEQYTSPAGSVRPRHGYDMLNLDAPEHVHLLRALILSQNGLNHLAAAEAEKIEAEDSEGQPAGKQVLAGAYLCLAWLHLQEHEFVKADAELAKAVAIWPDNPVSVYLTGERLAADGKYEAAAKSMERAAHGTQHEWLAARIAQRARQVRDSKGKADSLLLDRTFARDVALHYITEAASESAGQASQELQDYVDTVRNLGQRMDVQLRQKLKVPDLRAWSP